MYEVARSTDPLFTANCALPPATADLFVHDTTPLAPGEVAFLLVRPLAPWTGSWGQLSSGAALRLPEPLKVWLPPAHLEYRSTQFTKTGRQAQAADLRRRRPEHVNRFVTVRTVTGVRRRGPGRIKDENLLPFATGHRCVCQARAVLGLALSIVSEHVVIFKAAVLVDDRRERRWIHYGLASASRNHRGRGPENEWRWARRRRESA